MRAFLIETSDHLTEVNDLVKKFEIFRVIGTTKHSKLCVGLCLDCVLRICQMRAKMIRAVSKQNTLWKTVAFGKHVVKSVGFEKCD